LRAAIQRALGDQGLFVTVITFVEVLHDLGARILLSIQLFALGIFLVCVVRAARWSSEQGQRESAQLRDRTVAGATPDYSLLFR
jgi:hypothetical protein